MANDTTSRQIVYAGLVFLVIITGCFTIFASWLPTDNSNQYDSWNRSFNKLETMKESNENMAEQLENSVPDEGLLGILNGLVETSYSVITNMWTIVDIFTNSQTGIMAKVSAEVGIPVWLTNFFTIFILVTLIFSFLAIYFKWWT